ncbi:hypothetical protein TSUD_405800 [Trifolium subterraneum]|uniref:Reverse transcriptase domain-containing protein n=1 Tax=Trifolium subterraneum TaxID=3900 RepID=A0A2Z6PDM9_TRISU|nr:hypothetical protein TSUD_405800 [Trifolium subterraneum]
MRGNGYEYGYLEPNHGNVEFYMKYRFKPLEVDVAHSIGGVVGKDEIQKVVYDMGAWKAPCPDGYPAVVAQEMVHSMHKMRGKTGFAAIKVDLAKAYDRIRWSFIAEVLKEVGLPEELQNIIMHCITSVTTNVMWDGRRSSFFQPERGIRQGDPMSPYIFVLCMDKLTHLIAEAVDSGKWHPLKAGKAGPAILHLMFADDLLLFGKATEENVKAITDTLDSFSSLSGQMVSLEKTSILFSKNTNQNVKSTLLRQTGYREVATFGKYLGIPLVGRAPRRGDFDYLVDSVKAKLSGWKATHLSFAGRVTLAKSVIQAIPVYTMMTIPIPRSILIDIHRVQRNFIWGHEADQRRMHMVGWNKLLLPKSSGGLDIRSLPDMNSACLMKMGWEMREGKSSLWCNVLKGKYGRGRLEQGNIIARSSDSFIWKGLVKSWIHIGEFEMWTVGDGQTIKAWSDKWLSNEPGLDIYVEQMPTEMHSWTVSDMLNGDGNWNMSVLKNYLPQEILDKILILIPPRATDGADVRVWPGNRMGMFSVSSAYKLLRGYHLLVQEQCWSRVWSLDVPERVRCFIWLLIHGLLPTNKLCSKWGSRVSDCHLCIGSAETSMHVMRECSMARQVWYSLVPASKRMEFYTCSMEAKSTHRVVMDKSKVTIDVRWQPPAPNWISLHTDGAVQQGMAGCGGVFRNNLGHWLGGFAKKIGTTSAYIVELWGAYEGLRWARTRGYVNVELRMDSLVVVRCLNGEEVGSVDGMKLIRRIKDLLLEDWNVCIIHVYREANKVVDALAALGCDSIGISYFEDPLVEIEHLCLADVMGVSTPRVIFV